MPGRTKWKIGKIFGKRKIHKIYNIELTQRYDNQNSNASIWDFLLYKTSIELMKRFNREKCYEFYYMIIKYLYNP